MQADGELLAQFTATLLRIATRTQSAADVTIAGDMTIMRFHPVPPDAPDAQTASPLRDLPAEIKSAARDIRTVFGQHVCVSESLPELSMDGTMHISATIRDKAGVEEALKENHVIRLLTPSEPDTAATPGPN